MIDEYYTFKIFGYHSDDLSYGSGKQIVAVCDNCYCYRSLRMNDYRDVCVSCTQTGIKRTKRTSKQKVAMSKARLAPKDPLSYGWQSKLSDITKNKESATYLGSIAETILANIYKDVQVMPYSNHGYDIICNRDKRIDIKASATGDKGYWFFTIRKNMLTDYFLCIAFNSRDDLHNPVHLWLIPTDKINHLMGLTIRKSTLDKWSRYELSLDKLVACCNNLNNDKEV